MNVNVLGGWCSTVPPGALALHWGSSGDATWDVGARALQEAETLGKRGPTQRRRHSHPQLLVLVTGPRNYQVAGKHPFLCQRCVSLREIVPSEQRAMMTHYSTFAWNNPKTERPGSPWVR